MNGKIKNAFDQINATQELKNKTYQKVLERRYKSYNKFFNISRQIAVAVVFCFIIIGSSYFYFTPVYAISIDADTSIELLINRFDKVVGIKEYAKQEDSNINSLDIMHLNYNDAIDTIFSNDEIISYLGKEDIAITVVCENKNKNQKISNSIEQSISQNENITCDNGNMEDVSKAHDLDLSYGKYKAYLELVELNPEITVDDIKDLSMKEINEKISELSGEEDISVGNGQNNQSDKKEESGNNKQNGGNGKNQNKKGTH